MRTKRRRSVSRVHHRTGFSAGGSRDQPADNLTTSAPVRTRNECGASPAEEASHGVDFGDTDSLHDLDLVRRGFHGIDAPHDEAAKVVCLPAFVAVEAHGHQINSLEQEVRRKVFGEEDRICEMLL